MSAPFGDKPCMHEALFDDCWLKDTGSTTLDFAKAMIDEGYHPMTIYFPLVVHGAMLIEPTESEFDGLAGSFHRDPARPRLPGLARRDRALSRRPITPRAGALTKPEPPATPFSNGRRPRHSGNWRVDAYENLAEPVHSSEKGELTQFEKA